ncbi:MAG: nitronate monooxygenase [Raoultibacter sp.]|jgi:enoyl-[acyl-carrier protein] reductase II
MKTELCDLLGTEFPVIVGAMAHITDGEFAGKVSEAGALGVLTAGLRDGAYVKEQIAITRSITDKPFAVNIIMESSLAHEAAQACIDENVEFATISAGNPDKIVPMLAEAGIKTICLIPHVRAAKKMEALGATALVAEGMEGGGHIGKMCTMPMVRQVAEAVDIPVIAAGGIADGKGILASLMLGAVGVQMGTAFLVADECPVSDLYKQLIIDAVDTSTTLTGEPGEKQVRCLANPFTEEYWRLYHAGATSQELMDYCTGSISRAKAGDFDGGAFSAGMISGLINERKSIRKILEDLDRDMDESYTAFKKIYG